MNKTILAIAGPTASGKSRLAMQIAAHLKSKNISSEIICADSITIYRGFDIGSAKPSQAEQEIVPHHLLDICEPDTDFTAADFVKASDDAISAIQKKNALPIIVGGTGFYLRALIKGMTEQPDSAKALSPQIRASIETDIATKGVDAVYATLLSLDPLAITTIKRNDTYRIIRALEAMQITGKPWTKLNQEAKDRPLRYPHIRTYCLFPDKEKIQTNIEMRTKEMLVQGLVAEVRHLLEKKLATSKPMQSIGYLQTMQWLQAKKTDVSELEAAINLATKQLVKKQLTWFRAEKLYPLQILPSADLNSSLASEIHSFYLSQA